MSRRWTLYSSTALLLLASSPARLGADPAGEPGLLFRPVAACALLDNGATGSRLGLEPQALDGQELKPGCSPRSWSPLARAALLRVEANESSAIGNLRVWAGDEGEEPSAGGLSTYPGQAAQGLLLVDLCADSAEEAGACSRELWARLEGGDASVRLELVGLFELPREEDRVVGAIPEGAIPEATAASAGLVSPFWLEDANGIHFDGGFVGVGTALPSRQFQVGSWESADARYLMGGDSFSMQGIEGKDHLPYLEMRDETGLRAFYLGWGSKLYKYVTWKLENGYDLAIEGGNIGYGVSSPERNIHLRGTFRLQDPTSGRGIFDTWPRAPTGYGGGGPHNRSVPAFQTPFQRAGVTSDEYWVFASPEVWGGESAYSYAFNNKNLRFGVANDSWRRAEIEIYNDNTAIGKILFRTGAWQDPDNAPGTAAGLRMVIDGVGNVGLGTPAPAGKLVVTHDSTQPGEATATATIDSRTSDTTSAALVLRAPVAGGSPQELLRVSGDGRARLSGALEVGADLHLGGRLVPAGDLCIGVCP